MSLPLGSGDPVVDLSVIVVTYNSAGLLTKCLEGLVDLPMVEIFVVDNNSSDDVVHVLPPQVQLIEMTRNTGFAYAANRGAELASGRYLLLLNPDAVVSADAVHALIARLDECDAATAAAPLLRHPAGRLSIQTAGNFPTVWRMFVHFSGLSRIPRLDGHYLRQSDGHGRLVDWASGACLLIERDSWQRVGGLSERWFMYAEDVDLCWRLAPGGHGVLLCGDVSATHAVAGSSSGGEQRLNAMWILNLYDFYSLRMARSRLDRELWRWIVVGGLWSRAVAYWLRAKRNSADSSAVDWTHEARRFRYYAAELARARSSA